MSKYLSRSQNHVLIRKVAGPNVQERIDALNKVDKVLLERAATTGVLRRFFKETTQTDNAPEGLRIVTPEDQFYDSLVHEKPGVVYYLDPDPRKEVFSPKRKAITVGPDGIPRLYTFAGERYVESFEMLQTDANWKDVNELYVYPYDLVSYIENHSHKDLLDAEDVLFFKLINSLLSAGRDALAGKNIMVANEATFSPILFSNLKDQHRNKQVPFSRLLSHFSILNTIERTVESEIKGVAYEGLKGRTEIDTVFQMTPLSLETKQYCYYSFNVANKDLEDEQEQFFIDLNNLSSRNVAEMASAADKETQSKYIKDTMEDMGYKWNGMTEATAKTEYGTGYEFCRYIDVDNFYPRPPIYGDAYKEATASGSYKSIIAVLGKTMMRSYVTTPRPYFGHFDLFLEDAKTIVERNDKRILFYTEEQLILTAKNERAVTVLDVWTPVPVAL